MTAAGTAPFTRALQASGINVANYGTIFVTIADRDKEEALPLVRRFYDLGFNIEATMGTAAYLKSHGIRTRARKKISENSEEILESLRKGHVTYVINTMELGKEDTIDGSSSAVSCRGKYVAMSLPGDGAWVLLNVLEEITMGVSTIDSE